jgi:hypothetical protein
VATRSSFNYPLLVTGALRTPCRFIHARNHIGLDNRGGGLQPSSVAGLCATVVHTFWAKTELNGIHHKCERRSARLIGGLKKAPTLRSGVVRRAQNRSPSYCINKPRVGFAESQAKYASSRQAVAEKSFPVITYLIVPDISKGLRVYLCLRAYPEFAGVAQSVEHLICNQGVGGSNPFASSSKWLRQAAFGSGGATGFSKRTSFGSIPACSDLAQVSVSAILGFPDLRKLVCVSGR